MQSVINKELHVIFGNWGKQPSSVFRNMMKLPSLRSCNFIMFLKTNLGYLSQISLPPQKKKHAITGTNIVTGDKEKGKSRNVQKVKRQYFENL